MAAESHTYQFASFQLEQLFGPELPSQGIEDARPVWKRALLSLDIERSPLLVSFIEGSRGITSQIAVELSQQAVISRALEHYADHGFSQDGDAEVPLATALVREAFKQANHEVYHYAHRMRVGGKAAATGFVAAFDGRRFSIARVGAAASYIWRDGELVALFREQREQENASGVLERFIGANAQILVDLASLEVRKGDVIVIGSLPAQQELMLVAQRELRRGESIERAGYELLQEGIRLSLRPGRNGFQIDRNVFLAMLHVGAPLIRLTHVIE